MDNELRTIREEMGLSQPQFADRMGVSQATVSRWESGINKVPETALRYARILLQAFKGDVKARAS